MRLRNIVLEATTVQVADGSTEFKLDSTDPSARETVDDVHPWRGDVNSATFQVFQSATQLAGDSFIAVMNSGSADAQNIINTNDTMKMTGSFSSAVASTNQWGILMVANSVFEG